jgi:pyruvate,water dikinase
MDLCHLADTLGDDTPESVDALEQGIADRALPDEFLAGWQTFLDRYGHRGNLELDIAAPRYRDKPGILLGQIVQLRTQTDPQQTPVALYEKAKKARQEAYEALDQIVGERSQATAKRFRSLYKVLETLGGLRETHKFLVIKGIDHLRGRLLEYGRESVDAGRLDAPEQVFDLFLEDVEQALADPAFDVRRRVGQRRAVTDRMAQVPELPRVIDSRGRILRPTPPPAKEGELAGQPISSGVISGPVKVLHEPDEKPLLPGDILVARATDPGWTPLFVNAAAIVLEIGGLLQHGALVAREYGKPCVAGIAGATRELHDGQLVEVDGDAGVIRLCVPDSDR